MKKLIQITKWEDVYFQIDTKAKKIMGDTIYVKDCDSTLFRCNKINEKEKDCFKVIGCTEVGHNLPVIPMYKIKLSPKNEFDKWLEKEIGRQDSYIFAKGTLVRKIAIRYAEYHLAKRKK